MDDLINSLSIVSIWRGLGAADFFALGVVALVLAGVAMGHGSVPRKPFKPRRAYPQPVQAAGAIDIADPVRQIEYVARVDFEPQRLLNKSEYQVLVLLETVVRELNAGFRVMAQTSLGEILRPKQTRYRSDADLAYRAINSKRADFVVVDRYGFAVLAVEYQGHGHYREGTLLRDAVKREAFRKAGVAFLEVPAEYEKNPVKQAVRQVLERCLQGSARPA